MEASKGVGISASYVLVDEDASVLRRFKLYELKDGI